MTLPSRLTISRNEIRAVYAKGEDAVIELVETLVARINALEERVEILENQLKKDSHNSSKPPSGDGFKKRDRSLREKSERPSGGQIGHPGQTLEWSNEPTRTSVHRVHVCQDCGTSLTGTPVESWDVRQVHDLPRVAIEVTEHQCEVKCCPKCGILNRGEFPSEVKYSVQYGVNLQALTIYLLDLQLIPSLRVCELLADLYGVEMSEGTVYNMRERCFEALEVAELEIQKALKASDVVNCDETGFRVNGKLWWLHVACSDGLTFYFLHTKRGRIAMDSMGLLPDFLGVAVHDGWASYAHYACLHSLCNAHHLRELIFLVERYEQAWAKEMLTLLALMNKEVNQAKADGATALSPTRIAALEQQYREILERGFIENPAIPIPEDQPKPKGRPNQSKAKNLLDRLKSQQDAALRFLHDFAVPFDNNQAERDIRMMKLKQKISGGFRSETGARMFCRIRGYLSTLRKQGHSLLDALVQVFMGVPISPIPAAE